MFIQITPEYILTLMDIRAGKSPAPPEVVEQAKERLKMIGEELEKGGVQE